MIVHLAYHIQEIPVRICVNPLPQESDHNGVLKPKSQCTNAFLPKLNAISLDELKRHIQEILKKKAWPGKF